jgi:acyl-[acyl-carrier-protein]-phospholipid O-acyltransferase/long-chain-fatty-acid--[acyl-carrier-protein] ligase
MRQGTYGELLVRRKGFLPFLATQFLGAFNDNVGRWIVTLYLIDKVPGEGSYYAGLVGVLFILPSILFAGYAGQLADLNSKSRVMVGVKILELAITSAGYFAITSGGVEAMLVMPFLMGLYSAFFSPPKYGVLPELLPEKDLSRANSVLEMTTFLAIILGTALGGVLYVRWKGEPGLLNLILVGVAVAGLLCSLRIPRVPAASAEGRFRWNPWAGLGAGFRELGAKPTLRLTVLGITWFWFLGAFLLAAVTPLGEEVMGIDKDQTSLLETFLAVGIGLGSLLAGKLSGDKVELGLVPIGSIGMGLGAVAVWALHGSYAGAAAAFVFLGASAGLFAVPLNALLQQKGEKEGKGRLLAANNFVNALGMAAGFGLLSLLGGRWGLPADGSIYLVGLCSFLVTVYLLTILPDFLIRFSLWLLTHTLYRIRIRGSENVPFRGPALLVCNHVSLVDGLLVGACVQRFVRFLVWTPYFRHPAFHWLLKRMKAIPISPANRQELRESLERAREELRAGHVVCIFAEGAISRTGNMLPFKRGFERIIDGVDVPIIPVNLDGLWGSIFSFKEGRFVKKLPRKIPYPVTVSFGKPLPSTAKAEEVRLAVQELGADAAAERRRADDTLASRFVKAAKRSPGAFAMADSTGTTVTYGRALAGALLLAGWARKAAKGADSVGLLLPASVGGALANLGVTLAGKVPVNLNFTAGREAMDYAIQACGIQAILTSQIFLKKAGLEERPGMVFLEDLMRGFGIFAKLRAGLAARLLPARLIVALARSKRVRASDLATVIFSSGSTGTPKGVMLTHHNVLSNLEALEQVFWVAKEDRVLGVLPFFHSFGFTGTLWLPLVSGFGAVYHPNPMDAKAVGDLAERHRATLLLGTPTFVSAYARKVPKEQFASLRFVVVGAEKLREALAAEFREKYGLDLLEGYGSTEMAPVVSINVPDFPEERHFQKGLKPGTVGHPLPGVCAKVVDVDSGAVLGTSQEGLLLVKGPNRMMGYLGQPERTAEVLRDGWYVTGDLAKIDDDGFITITDRLSRFSKIGGEMVPHGKVEEVLAPLLGAHAGAVTSLPDAQRGERLVILHTHPELEGPQIREQLMASPLPKLWIPKEDAILKVDALPLLGSGKLDLRGLRALAKERLPGGE